MMEKVTIWKRFKGWVIVLRNKLDVYRGNLLFVTRVKTLATHLAFIIFLLLVFWLYLNYAERQILEQVLQSLEHVLSSGNASVHDLESVSVHLRLTYGIVFAGILFVMTVILYFLAGLTLRPIRKNMEHQRRFIADVSHELRTPLSVMRADAEVALLAGSTDLDRRKALTGNIEEINRISIIINNLISFTNVDGLSTESFSSVHLYSVISRSTEKLRMLARTNGVRMNVECEEDVKVWGNEVALEQAITNLVKNALTHTPAEGEVTIVAQKSSGGHTQVTVSDNGYGIPEEDLSRIFEAFFKSGKSVTANRGSVGLGLALVKEIVRTHKGSLEVESLVGEGTTFRIFLPVSA